jgi:hypothetical protein
METGTADGTSGLILDAGPSEVRQSYARCDDGAHVVRRVHVEVGVSAFVEVGVRVRIVSGCCRERCRTFVWCVAMPYATLAANIV